MEGNCKERIEKARRMLLTSEHAADGVEYEEVPEVKEGVSKVDRKGAVQEHIFSGKAFKPAE